MAPEQSSPHLKAPPGACDTHFHIYEPGHPMAPSALIPPPDAPLAAYRDVQRRLGLERAVVVQPTTYGKDNRVTLSAMRALGARGVVAVDTTVSDEQLQTLTAMGVRGIRFFKLPGGALPWSLLDEMAARVHQFGWHVQVQLNGLELPDQEATLRRLPGTLVVDHVGRFHGGVSPDHPGFRSLLRLVEAGHTWVKLSAPYESTPDDAPTFPVVGRLARALVAAAPGRMVWASNWPHPGHDPRFDDAMVLDLLLHWVDDEAARNRILVDNAAVLYGF